MYSHVLLPLLGSWFASYSVGGDHRILQLGGTSAPAAGTRLAMSAPAAGTDTSTSAPAAAYGKTSASHVPVAAGWKMSAPRGTPAATGKAPSLDVGISTTQYLLISELLFSSFQCHEIVIM
jgi:hypothetical protein